MRSKGFFSNDKNQGGGRRMGSVLTFDTGDARMGAGQLPQDFAKFFSSMCHVTLRGAGDGQPTAAGPLCRSVGDKPGVYQPRGYLSLFVSWLASAS
jgi:hypothetical protein